MSATTLSEQESEATPVRGRRAQPWWVRTLVAIVVLSSLAAAYWGVQRLWTSPQEHFERARAALHAGHMEQVRDELKYLQAIPAFAPHRRFLQGSLYLQEGRFDDALQEYEFCVHHPELQLETLIRSGQAYYQTGRAGNAQQLWHRVLELQPDQVDVHRWLGVLYYDVGAMDLALHHLGKVSALDPNDPRPDRLMGLINKDYERPDLAVKHYQESLRRNSEQPGHAAILLELARCQIKLFDYAAALQTLEKCLPTPERQMLQAECHLSMGEKKQAQSLLSASLATDPKNKEALLLQGRMELEDGRFAESVKTLLRATELFPKDYVVRFKLVQALRRNGDPAEADRQEVVANQLKDLWRRFSDLHMRALREPTNANARQELGHLALQLDRPDLAKNWFQAVLAIEPENQEAQRELGKLVNLSDRL